MSSELARLLGRYIDPPARAIPAGATAYQCECEWCAHRWRDAERNPETCPRCGSLGEHETAEGAQA